MKLKQNASLTLTAMAVLGILASHSTHAAPFTVIINGTVGTIDDPQHQLDDSITYGSIYQATYSFDSAAGVVYTSAPEGEVVYGSSISPSGATVIVGNYNLAPESSSLASSSVVIFDKTDSNGSTPGPDDNIALQAYGSSDSHFHGVVSSAQFDGPNTLFSSQAMVPDVLALVNGVQSQPGSISSGFSTYFGDTNNSETPYISGSITSVSTSLSNPASAAPEPSQFAALAFTGLGISGLMIRARKRTAMSLSK